MTKSVMFVCLGNICRSPAAEGILKSIAPQIKAASSGTGNWHIGELPDHRMIAAAQKRGIALTSRAQQFRQDFFNEFDLILAADQSVKKDLLEMASGQNQKDKVFLINHFSISQKDQDVPDPYYGDLVGFDSVLDILHDAINGIVKHCVQPKT